MAVAKALGARRILAIDVQEKRLEFAKQYAATEVHAAIPKNPGEDSMAYSKRHVSPQSARLLWRRRTLTDSSAGTGDNGEVRLRRERRGRRSSSGMLRCRSLRANWYLARQTPGNVCPSGCWSSE